MGSEMCIRDRYTAGRGGYTAACILAALDAVGACGACDRKRDCFARGLSQQVDHKQNLNKAMSKPDINKINTSYSYQYARTICMPYVCAICINK